jgi:hypothetical protein
MASLSSAKWIWWLALYGMMGVMVPWALVSAWIHQRGTAWKPTVREIFKEGELGLVGLILAASVIWDLQKSSFTFVTIAVGSILLALSGIMAANVWVETYCRKTTTTRHDPARSWRDSRNLAFLVFSIAMVAETLLDRLAKVLPS